MDDPVPDGRQQRLFGQFVPLLEQDEGGFAYIHLVSSIKIRQTFPEPLFAAIAPACLMGHRK